MPFHNNTTGTIGLAYLGDPSKSTIIYTVTMWMTGLAMLYCDAAYVVDITLMCTVF